MIFILLYILMWLATAVVLARTWNPIYGISDAVQAGFFGLTLGSIWPITLLFYGIGKVASSL